MPEEHNKKMKKLLKKHLLFLVVANVVLFALLASSDDSVKVFRQFGASAPPEGMVLIPAGAFEMGSDDENADEDEQPVHNVYVDAFYIDTHEVTVGQYQRFIQETEHRALPDWVSKYSPTGEHPVVGVSWHDAMAYAQWAGKRLPTEAEWEKAARGGVAEKKYPWGDSIDASHANYNKNVDKTATVGSYPANAHGLYDMAGNVWEWCLDAYSSTFYIVSPRQNPVAGASSFSEIISIFPSVKTARVVRGGSWFNKAKSLRVSARDQGHPTGAANFVGFRCAKTVSDEPVDKSLPR